ncbi:UbiH/UbiF family hydroxylase [Aquibium sp. A9E412]|uniref:UbiH/UbiF family hydroxylase n=1 Tax=Aquibium sp. A9E412 TaxID=2976767 RepID=UPI0025AF103F|nr:UbiH/UbiF family hydroxylase [Aquibium sp. A9E412]MDN2566342.1 UbiH/UbiF family hydroxylase [Aquibium sp. A9E412]
MSQTSQSPILVAGSGPAGLVAALALAADGWPVTLVGPRAAPDDGRTTALMRPALDVLEAFGVVARLGGAAAPLEAMRIVDATGRLLRGPTVTFHAREIGEDLFGLNIPNRALAEALRAAVAEAPLIEWRDTTVAAWRPEAGHVAALLADGDTVEAQLAVAADGRASPARRAAGIECRTRSYPQAALVLNFAHTREHGGVSTEFHTATGPCTQVPLPGLRSSLVWVVEPEMAETLRLLDDDALSLRVEQRLDSILGKVTVEGPRQIYPLSAVTPERVAARRIALVGEAAHVFPPIGAQGLNLGIRDVEDLVGIAARHRDDPGAAGALDAYDRRRRPDILARSTAVNLLNMSLLSNLLPAQLVRGAGLSLLGRVAPLRGFVMREGMRPGSGLSALLPRSREQVGRQ